jgi:hypothetical protein
MESSEGHGCPWSIGMGRGADTNPERFAAAQPSGVYRSLDERPTRCRRGPLAHKHIVDAMMIAIATIELTNIPAW